MAHTKVFKLTKDAVLQTPRPRYVVSVGGTRSGKTFAILQVLNYLVETDNAGEVTSVVSETLPHLKRGAIRDFEAIIGHPLKDDPQWNETEHVYTYPKGGKLEFFSVDNPSRVQGPARKRLFINEGIHIKYDTYRQLAVRTAGVIFIDYNPEFVSWIEERIQPKDNCVTIHSTYKDNDYLTAEQIQEIESNRGDANWWRVYGEGKVGQLEGLIFPDFEQVDDLPKPEERPDGMVEAYGLDFGFTNDPSVLIHVLVDTRSREIWADEVFYRTGMLNSDMAAAMKEAEVKRKTVYADAAEPKTIEELRRYGFNVQPSYKATRKAEQLQAMKGYRQKITKRSLNLIREHRGYTWQRDKDGSFLNEPVGVQDHAEDALRYGCFPALKAYRESHRTISLT